MNFAGLLAESYSLWSTKAENDLSVNWWREQIQSGQGVNTHYARRSAGISPQITGMTAGRVRGMFDASVNGEERLWAAVGAKLYESADGVSAASKGAIADDGGFVQFAASQNSMLLVSAGILYRLNSGTLAAVSISFTPIGIAFLKNLFVVLADTLQQFYWSEDDGATFPADQVQTFESDANDVYGIDELNEQLWLVGNRVTQIYYVGTNENAPFVPNDSATLASGTASAATIRKLGASLIWLEKTGEGIGSVVMTEGYGVRKVSNFYIDNAINALSRTVDLSTATALSFELAGHEFYRLTVGDKTFEYHKTQNEWEEVSWFNWLLGTQHKHRGFSAVQAFGKTLIGDHTNGIIYELSVDTYHDYGFPMRVNRRCPHIIEEQKRVEIKRFELGMETGVGLVEPLWLNQYTMDLATFVAALAVQVAALTVSAAQAVVLQQIYDFEPYTPLNPYPTPQVMNDLGFFPWGAQSALDDGTIIGTAPQIVMRYSKDGGKSYGNEMSRSMGLAGEDAKLVYWNRCGMARDFVFDIFTTEPVKLAITQGIIEAEALAS